MMSLRPWLKRAAYHSPHLLPSCLQARAYLLKKRTDSNCSRGKNLPRAGGGGGGGVMNLKLYRNGLQNQSREMAADYTTTMTMFVSEMATADKPD